MLGQSCQGQCASGSCPACTAAVADCSAEQLPADGSNAQKAKVAPHSPHKVKQRATILEGSSPPQTEGA